MSAVLDTGLLLDAIGRHVGAPVAYAEIPSALKGGRDTQVFALRLTGVSVTSHGRWCCASSGRARNAARRSRRPCTVCSTTPACPCRAS